MITCSVCGRELKGVANTCPECGALFCNACAGRRCPFCNAEIRFYS
ncbi:MAG: zinc-ribbon domain-containing protein [Christensenellales bacterium]